MTALAHQEAPELGIAEMDAEHRELTELFNDFARCIKEGGTAETAYAIVRRAVDCANAHFEHEEQLAEKAAFPDIEEEKFHHRNMRLKFTTLVGDTMTNTSHNPVTLENLKEMRAILDEHMNGPDRKLALFLKAAGYS